MKGKLVINLVLSVLVLVLMFSTASPGVTASEGAKARVWVQFAPGSKAPVERALNVEKAEFHYVFEDLNAFVVTVPEAALAGLVKNPNVVLIEEDAKRFPMGQTVPYGIDMVQARDVWDANRDGAIDTNAPTGSGRIVCIIDSGVFKNHEDLQTVNFIGGYPSGWNTDKCGHGTHVAGTIAAANNTAGVVGVTPGGLDIYIVKVFGDDCSWTYSSTLVDAANRCEAAGADVINMSLGGTLKNRTEDTTFANLNSKGVLSIAAAGNDGNTRVSYPAGYASVVSVAAVDSNKVVADFSQQNADVELAAPGVGVFSTVPFTSTNTLAVDGVTYTGSQIEFAAIGTGSGALVDGGLCGSAGSWAGKVVLCERGTYDFYTKVMSVQNGGGTAAVIYNNVAGGFAGTLGAGNSSTIPAISLSQEDGQFLVANKLGLAGTVTSSPIIYDSNGYEAWDGTSMATPHVSGVAALIWSANPSWTNQEIRDAMTSTAQDLGSAGRDNAYGYGLVQAKAALDFLGGVTPPPPPDEQPLTVTVATDKLTYTNRQTVYITNTVTGQDNTAVASAAVNVSIATGNGTTVSKACTTGSAGTCVVSWKVDTRKYGAGTHTVTSTASKSGYTSGTGTTTFTVE